MLPLQYVILHWPCPFSSTEVHMTATEVIAITFCCFLLLMLAVSVGCMYKMFNPKPGVCFCVSVCEGDMN